MKRLIIGVVDNPDALEIGRHRGAVDIQGVVVDFLEDDQLIEGKAVGWVEREPEVPVVEDDFITTEREIQEEQVLTEFIADPESGYVAIDSGDGEFLWDFLEVKNGIQIERAHIDVDAIGAQLEAAEQAGVWQVGYDREDDDLEEVALRYHDDASMDDVSEGGLTMLGFRWYWDGAYLEGAIAQSGYVALWAGSTTELIGRWLREAVLPHTDAPVGQHTQETLEEGETA